MHFVQDRSHPQAQAPNPAVQHALWQAYPDLVSQSTQPVPCAASADAARVVSLMAGRRKVRQGEGLYRQSDPFHSLYAVQSGSFKSTLALANGCQQVNNFHMAGELLGLDGVADGQHGSSATALEDSEISALPYRYLSELCTSAGALQGTVMRLISREVVRSNHHIVMLGSLNSAQRLAAFLLNQSQRLSSRGYSAVEFHLKMTRGEIGSYLGMTLETVSRTFTELQQQRLLTVERRHIQITSLDDLARVQRQTLST
jgi:CRP/FNR family transcriptional regulator